MKPPKTFYKFRTFDIRTLEHLCNNTVHFTNPVDFNDPLDCNPTVECDSSIDDMRKLLMYFINARTSQEVLEHIRKSKIKISGSVDLAKDYALRQAKKEATFLSYLATNPMYEDSPDGNESNLITQAIERELIKSFESGVFCLSTRYDCQLLWSHYGDQHKGICISYEPYSSAINRPVKVEYGGKRTISTSRLVEAYLNESFIELASVRRDVLLRKASGWEYEGEWRIIGKQGIQDSPLKITEITFGLRCSRSVKQAVMATLSSRSYPIDFFDMYSDRKSFRLRRRQIDINEFNAGSNVDPNEFEDLTNQK